MFSNLQRVEVGYVILDDGIIPSGVYSNINKQETPGIGCPSVSSASDRILSAYSYLDIVIDVWVEEDRPVFKYRFKENSHPLTEEMHEFVNRSIQLDLTNNVMTLQIKAPYCFITDDPELEFITVPPQVKTKNLSYVPGTLKPYGWIRNINSTWKLDNNKKPGQIELSLDDRLITYVFNKKINLQYMDPTEQIKNYVNQTNNVLLYRLKTKRIFNNLLARRPKRFL